MNHLPFEEWLLNNSPITLEQQRDLDLHLRACAYCSALAETGKVLSNIQMATPAPGFTMRFQTRLAERKAADRRKKLWGMTFFTLGGLVLLMWMVGPYLVSFLAAPATWISVVVGWLVFIGTTPTQRPSCFLEIAPRTETAVNFGPVVVTPFGASCQGILAKSTRRRGKIQIAARPGPY